MILAAERETEVAVAAEEEEAIPIAMHQVVALALQIIEMKQDSLLMWEKLIT